MAEVGFALESDALPLSYNAPQDMFLAFQTGESCAESCFHFNCNKQPPVYSMSMSPEWMVA